MEWNWVVIIAWLVLLGGALKGLKRGFIAEVSSICSTAAALAAVTIFIMGVKEYMRDGYIQLIILVIVLLLLVTIHKIVNFLLTSLKLIVKLPIAGSLDKLLGFVFGAANTIVLFWIFFLILEIYPIEPIAGYVVREVKNSRLLSILYENNMILLLVSKYIMK